METVFINRIEVCTSLHRYTSYIHEDDITQCTNLCRDVCGIIVAYIDEYSLVSVAFKDLTQLSSITVSPSIKAPSSTKAELQQTDTKRLATKLVTRFKSEIGGEMFKSERCGEMFKSEKGGENLLFNYNKNGEITLCYNNSKTYLNCKVHAYNKWWSLAFDIYLTTSSVTRLVRISKGIFQGKSVNIANVIRVGEQNHPVDYSCEAILDPEFMIVQYRKNKPVDEQYLKNTITESIAIFQRLLQLCDYVNFKFSNLKKKL